MKNKRQADSGIPLGMLSLPVMACVLGAVLFGTDRQAPEPLDSKHSEALTQLEPRVAQVDRRVAEVADTLDRTLAITRDIQRLKQQQQEADARLAALRKDREALAASVSASQERASLLKRLSEREQEIAALSNKLARTTAETNALATRLVLTGLDDFPKPFVSVDCESRASKVYAPKQPMRTIRSPIDETDKAWLREQLLATRAVVLFARAACFEQDAYWDIRGAIVKIQDDEEKAKRDVAFCYLPIQDHEDLSGHILLGQGQ